MFEYSPEKDLLGEWAGKKRPFEYVTSADLFIEAEENNKKYAFLFEIKFTENEFGSCNGNISNGCTSEERKNCENFANVINNKEKCFLHRKNKTRSARKYFENFDLTSEIKLIDNACPFKENNQCLRNHAFARSLKKDNSTYEKTFFSLIYYDNNLEIEKAWNNYFNVMKQSKDLFVIKASDIIQEYKKKNKIYGLYFEKRYGIQIQHRFQLRCFSNHLRCFSSQA